MFRIYFKTAWRNLFRNATSTLVNLLGLSVALAAFVFIALWVQNELSFDSYHKNAKDAFLVQMRFSPDDKGSPITPLPLGEALRTARDVDLVARMAPWWGTFNVKGKLFDEKAGIAVDSDWFNIFDYPVVSGEFRSFANNPSSIIFTQSRAKQLFGSDNPVGQVVRLDTTLYVVRAVVKDNPINSSLQFDMFVPMAARLAHRHGDLGNWTNSSYRTFVKLRPNTTVSVFTANASALIARQSGHKDFSVALQPLPDLHFDSESSDAAFRRGSRTAVLVFSLLAALLLISASINYVNLTFSEANVRTKEISIRKIVGGSARQLFLQFLTESFLMCVIALVLSFFIMSLSLPFFDRLTETDFRLSAASGTMWLVFASTLVVTTLLNGLFPAFSVALFKPLNFLQGTTILKFTNVFFRKGLVVFQFVIGIVFIIVTVVIFRQMKLAQDSAAQYNRTQVASFVLPDQLMAKLGYDQGKMTLFSQTFTNDLRVQSYISDVVFASCPPEGEMNTSGIQNWYWDGMDTSAKATVARVAVEPGASNVFNLQIEKGRWFKKDKSDKRNFIINETAVRQFGIPEPVIGQTFARKGEDTGQIIGVIRDYNFSSLYNQIQPMVISDNETEFRPYFFVRISPGNVPKAMDAIAAVWKKDIPGAPLEYQFMDQAFDNLYKNDLKISNLVLLFSFISIAISALGLFSLSAFVAEQRKKEIGIRKVMGAAVSQIATMLSKQFLTLVIVAAVIASPIGYWVINKWLNNFAYKIEISWWIFAAADLLVLLIAMATVSYHAVRAALANPVKTLRKE